MNGPYKIGTLARLTGFSPALLRVWESELSDATAVTVTFGLTRMKVC